METKHTITHAKYILKNIREVFAGLMDTMDSAISCLECDAKKMGAYNTPQWHHTVLWAGFAFLIGMLLGAGLMAG